jgi:general secretion pathway protein F
MAIFQYKGLDARSKRVTGLIDADSAKAAVAKLKKNAIYPIEVTETAERQKALKFRVPWLEERVSPLELTVLTRQLSTLVGAGLPLVQCLSALTEQLENPKLKSIIAEVRGMVNEGSSFADALAHYPRVFGDFFVNMIRAGEQSGALEVVLKRLADFTESQSRLRDQVLFALMYPVVILLLSLMVMLVMFTYVIPKISLLFEQTHQTLPLLTKIMIFLSMVMRKFFWLIGILAGAGIYGFRRWKKSPEGKARWDEFVLKIPLFGQLIRKLAVARFARTLSTLLQSGIPLLKSLDIVKRVVNNTVIANAVARAHDNITEGASIAGPLKASGAFPPFVIQMIASGEQSGELEFLLEKAAEAFEREVETTVNGLVRLIEPFMILFMAGMVGIIIVSFLLPILQLTQGIK